MLSDWLTKSMIAASKTFATTQWCTSNLSKTFTFYHGWRLRLFCSITYKLISCAASCCLTAVGEISDFPSVCKERYHHTTQSRTVEGYIWQTEIRQRRGDFLPIMAYSRSLRPRGVPFSGLGISKSRDVNGWSLWKGWESVRLSLRSVKWTKRANNFI